LPGCTSETSTHWKVTFASQVLRHPGLMPIVKSVESGSSTLH
jgi:hypothetical protein